MTIQFLINIVVAIAYYCICFFIFSYLIISECISFLNNNPLFPIIITNIIVYLLYLKNKNEKQIYNKIIFSLSREIIILNDKLLNTSNFEVPLLIENKKEMKIDHLYKKCKQCNKLKTIIDYNKNLNSKDHHTNYCKECNVNF
jgi:hypothetical protein